MPFQLDNYYFSTYKLLGGQLQTDFLLLVAVCPSTDRLWKEAPSSTDHRNFWPRMQSPLQKAEQRQWKEAIDQCVCGMWCVLKMRKHGHLPRITFSTKYSKYEKTSFLTPCQGFLTYNTFERSRNVSPASVFCSPSENTVKNGAAQLPVSTPHLADSRPYSGSVSIAFGVTEEKPKSIESEGTSHIFASLTFSRVPMV